MPQFRFKVKVNNIPKALTHLNSAINDTLNEIGDKAVEHVRKKVPVDTGTLRDSYIKDVIPDQKAVRVGSAMEYAPFVELGTGPNYRPPPDWVKNYAQRGHHDVDPWWYEGDDGEWHLGWFVRARPHLQPAFLDHVGEYKDIFKKNLKNA